MSPHAAPLSTHGYIALVALSLPLPLLPQVSTLLFRPLSLTLELMNPVPCPPLLPLRSHFFCSILRAASAVAGKGAADQGLKMW
jgi:hypothetical protein